MHRLSKRLLTLGSFIEVMFFYPGMHLRLPSSLLDLQFGLLWECLYKSGIPWKLFWVIISEITTVRQIPSAGSTVVMIIFLLQTMAN